MNQQMQHCAELIDQLDGILAEFHTATGVSSVPVVSATRDTGIVDQDYLVVKNKLLTAMKDTFVDKLVCDLHLSKLMTFCYQCGYEFVTQHITPGKQVFFFIRTPGFDMTVEHKT